MQWEDILDNTNDIYHQSWSLPIEEKNCKIKRNDIDGVCAKYKIIQMEGLILF